MLLWCEAVHEAADGIPEGLGGSWFLGMSRAFSLAKARSIGFKSGLSGGMNIRLVPAASMASRTPSPYATQGFIHGDHIPLFAGWEREFAQHRQCMHRR
jgi:hypothetical protein